MQRWDRPSVSCGGSAALRATLCQSPDSSAPGLALSWLFLREVMIFPKVFLLSFEAGFPQTEGSQVKTGLCEEEAALENVGASSGALDTPMGGNLYVSCQVARRQGPAPSSNSPHQDLLVFQGWVSARAGVQIFPPAAAL